MPIDPSIISNAFANVSMPDVNALMQQRVRGAENIYQIERQRQADAASEQEDMQAKTLQALSPAVAAAFEDPSDAGLDAAFSLVPEEYGDAADAQLAKLRSIPDVNRRKAVIRSALLQDDYGRALLAQLEPTANMRMQEGTAARRAALDERRMALEEAKLAAEAEGGGITPYQQAQLDLEREKLEAAKTKETAAETTARLKEDKRAKELAFAVEQVEAAAVPGGLLDKATGSYLGNLVDTAAQTIGYGTEGAIANARMKPIADLVLKMVPRFEGPQAIPDVQSYKEASGDLANPNLPTSVKKAAAAEIVRLFNKYQNQFEYAGGGGEEGAGLPNVMTDAEFDALPSGAEFIDPEGQRRRKP
jgi:hypothetical protein